MGRNLDHEPVWIDSIEKISYLPYGWAILKYWITLSICTDMGILI